VLFHFQSSGESLKSWRLGLKESILSARLAQR
jgi:hypothetical protein